MKKGMLRIFVLLVVALSTWLASVSVMRRYEITPYQKERLLKSTTSVLANAESGIELFRHDVGTLPDSLSDLYANPSQAITNWSGPYLQGRIETLKDGWQRSIVYAVTTDRASYELKSLGPDGVVSVDDIAITHRITIPGAGE